MLRVRRQRQLSNDRSRKNEFVMPVSAKLSRAREGKPAAVDGERMRECVYVPVCVWVCLCVRARLDQQPPFPSASSTTQHKQRRVHTP